MLVHPHENEMPATEGLGGAPASSRLWLRIEAWIDPVIDELGHDPRSAYVETFWLPVLGPPSITRVQ